MRRPRTQETSFYVFWGFTLLFVVALILGLIALWTAESLTTNDKLADTAVLLGVIGLVGAIFAGVVYWD